nr:uncharacterized protein LOC117854809 [Setaria viridis]
MANCKPASTPADTSTKASNSEGNLIFDALWYRSMAGALQYLTLTRPDIAYAIQQDASFHYFIAQHLRSLFGAATSASPSPSRQSYLASGSQFAYTASGALRVVQQLLTVRSPRAAGLRRRRPCARLGRRASAPPPPLGTAAAPGRGSGGASLGLCYSPAPAVLHHPGHLRSAVALPGRPARGAGRAPRRLAAPPEVLDARRGGWTRAVAPPELRTARRRPAGVADRAPSPPLVVLVPRRRPLAQAASRARMTYKGAGVDIDAGAELVRRIRKMTPGIGGFGGHYILAVENAQLWKATSVGSEFFLQSATISRGDNCYVEVTGGVGTKLKLAFETSIHDTIGVDLVAMSVNDIVTSGARPLFFQDYYGASLMLTLQRRLSRGLWIGVNNQTVFTWEESLPVIGGSDRCTGKVKPAGQAVTTQIQRLGGIRVAGGPSGPPRGYPQQQPVAGTHSRPLPSSTGYSPSAEQQRQQPKSDGSDDG